MGKGYEKAKATIAILLEQFGGLRYDKNNKVLNEDHFLFATIMLHMLDKEGQFGDLSREAEANLKVIVQNLFVEETIKEIEESGETIIVGSECKTTYVNIKNDINNQQSCQGFKYSGEG